MVSVYVGVADSRDEVEDNEVSRRKAIRKGRKRRKQIGWS